MKPAMGKSIIISPIIDRANTRANAEQNSTSIEPAIIHTPLNKIDRTVLVFVFITNYIRVPY